MRLADAAKWVERSLVAIGALLVTGWAGLLLDRSMNERGAGDRAATLWAAADQGIRGALAAPSGENPAQTGQIGWIEIPRLDIRAPVRAGTGKLDLLRAVGHVSGTALPGEKGNVALAAHRDGYFRALGGVVPGDSVVVTTVRGRFVYDVASTEIVDPGRVDLLASARYPSLTLITCYPFRYIGPAPRRFIVSATARELPSGS